MHRDGRSYLNVKKMAAKTNHMLGFYLLFFVQTNVLYTHL
jgi:hypothetical protein